MGGAGVRLRSKALYDSRLAVVSRLPECPDHALQAKRNNIRAANLSMFPFSLAFFPRKARSFKLRNPSSRRCVR